MSVAFQAEPIAVGGFPREMLVRLRCTRDVGSLTLVQALATVPSGIVEGRIRCQTCSAEYGIQEGIARMLDEAQLTPEDRNEMNLRDTGDYALTGPGASDSCPEWRSPLSDALEIPPHLEELSPLNGLDVLEVGCGDGRFTTLMAGRGARVMAVDLSLNALRLLGSRLSSEVTVARVQADFNHFHVAPCSFHRALSTTPLDSRDERMNMYRIIADALTNDGRYVGGVENDNLYRRLLGLPLARRYVENGIFIEHLDIPSLRREIAPYFAVVNLRPIRPKVPFASRLPLPLGLALSRFVAGLPLVRRVCEILMFRAERPVRSPIEGQRRHGNRLAIGIFRWYRRIKGNEPIWGTDERV